MESDAERSWVFLISPRSRYSGAPIPGLGVLPPLVDELRQRGGERPAVERRGKPSSPVEPEELAERIDRHVELLALVPAPAPRRRSAGSPSPDRISSGVSTGAQIFKGNSGLRPLRASSFSGSTLEAKRQIHSSKRAPNEPLGSALGKSCGLPSDRLLRGRRAAAPRPRCGSCSSPASGLPGGSALSRPRPSPAKPAKVNLLFQRGRPCLDTLGSPSCGRGSGCSWRSC